MRHPNWSGYPSESAADFAREDQEGAALVEPPTPEMEQHERKLVREAFDRGMTAALLTHAMNALVAIQRSQDSGRAQAIPADELQAVVEDLLEWKGKVLSVQERERTGGGG